MPRRKRRRATNHVRISAAGSAARWRGRILYFNIPVGMLKYKIRPQSGRFARRAAAGTLALCLFLIPTAHAQSRLDLIRKRGAVVCGVQPGVRGFAEVDARGQYSGLDVDICRALAAAIFGTADKVRFVPAGTVDAFLKSSEADLVSRRLTWSLQREGLGLLFGPVTFYDGQGFLVPRTLKVKAPADLANKRICIVPGTVTEYNLNTY